MTCYNMQGNTEAYAQWLDSKVAQPTSLSHQHTPSGSPTPTQDIRVKGWPIPCGIYFVRIWRMIFLNWLQG